MVRRGKFNDCQSSVALWTNSIIQIILFVLFLVFFGIPSIEKYLDKQTIMVSSEEQTNGIEAPAITLVALKKRGVPTGWKSVNKDLNYQSFVMIHHCQAMNFTDMDICQKNDTYERGDFLMSAALGFFKENSTSLLNESSMWTEDMAVTYYGRHFTLNPSMTMTKTPHHAFIFQVDKSFGYYVWLHDENFFIVNQNPFGLPSKLWIITGNELSGKNGLYHEITLTKHKKLNLDRRPCEEDPKYSFLTCTKEKLSEKVGCRLPWDRWSKQDRAICTAEHEFGHFEQIYRKLDNAESDEIVEMTGCLQPCSYNEYKFALTSPRALPKAGSEPMPIKQSRISFWAASSKTHINEEVLLYPFTSLLAEFGGALGLFLGFSFMAIWQEIKGFCWK